MNENNNIEQQLKQLGQRFKNGPSVADQVMQYLDHAPARKWSQIMKTTTLKWLASAAAVILIVLVLTYNTPFGSTSIAWAEIPAILESISTVQFRVGMDAEVQWQTHHVEICCYRSSQYGARSDVISNGQLKEQNYIIPEEKSFIHIDHQSKKYRHRSLGDNEIDQEIKAYDPREYVRAVMQKDYVELGTKTIGGIKAAGIEQENPCVIVGGLFESAMIELWVDVDTHLPVLIEVEGTASNGGYHATIVMDDFQWDVDLDPSVFEPDIGPDYTAEELPNSPSGDEETAIESLRLFAEISDGKYPSDLALLTTLKEICEAYGKKYPEKLNDKLNELNSISSSLSKWYASLAREGKEPAYYGDIVTANDADLVLLRWKTQENEYQVIFGDLHRETVDEATLADLESKLPQ